MAKIYYCGGPSGRTGTLRTILQLGELSDALKQQGLDYVGKSFPQLETDSAPCVVIGITCGEERNPWRGGFYRLSQDPVDFEDLLRPGKPSNTSF